MSLIDRLLGREKHATSGPDARLMSGATRIGEMFARIASDPMAPDAEFVAVPLDPPSRRALETLLEGVSADGDGPWFDSNAGCVADESLGQSEREALEAAFATLFPRDLHIRFVTDRFKGFDGSDRSNTTVAPEAIQFFISKSRPFLRWY